MHAFGMAPVRAFGRPSGPFRRTYRAYDATHLGDGRSAAALERGDKVILHASALGELHEQMTKGPLIFEVSSSPPHGASRSTHVGVLEFSGDDEHRAYLPSWVMDNLLVGEGDPVNFRLKTLPKVTFVKLQPEDYTFAESVSEPRAALEHVLRGYTALTLGDNIRVEYAGTEFRFTVTDLRPAKAVSLLQAECEVDFDEPAGGKPTSFAVLKEGEPVSATVDVGDANYYTLVLSVPDTGTTISLSCKDGADADLYISTTGSKPSRAAHDWAVTTSSSEKSIALSPSDPKYPDGVASGGAGSAAEVSSSSKRRVVLHVGVHGYRASTSRPSSSTGGAGRTTGLHGESDSKADSKSADGGGATGSVAYTLRADVLGDVEAAAAAGATKLSGGSSGTAGPGMQQCDNCGQYVPERTIVMHSAFCARNNFRCSECGEVMRLSEKEKHLDVRHKPLPCACGRMIAPDLMSTHQQFECELRKLPCTFCGISVASSEFASHKEYCGARTVPCEQCGQSVVVKQMSNHMAAKHGVNPSLPSGVVGAAAREVAAMKLSKDIAGGEGAAVSGDGPASESSLFSSAPLHRQSSAEPVVDSRRRFPVRGAAAAVVTPGRAAATETLACPYCATPCPSFADLQVHLLTTCPRGAEVEAGASDVIDAAAEAHRKAELGAAIEAATVADLAEPPVEDSEGTNGVGGMFGALAVASDDDGDSAARMQQGAEEASDEDYAYESDDDGGMPSDLDDDEETQAALALSLGLSPGDAT